MSKDAEAKAIEALEGYRQQEGVKKVTNLLKTRIERHRDRLESEESAEVRGRIRELRDLLKIICE